MTRRSKAVVSIKLRTRALQKTVKAIKGKDTLVIYMPSIDKNALTTTMLVMGRLVKSSSPISRLLLTRTSAALGAETTSSAWF